MGYRPREFTDTGGTRCGLHERWQGMTRPQVARVAIPDLVVGLIVGGCAVLLLATTGPLERPKGGNTNCRTNSRCGAIDGIFRRSGDSRNRIRGGHRRHERDPPVLCRHSESVSDRDGRCYLHEHEWRWRETLNGVPRGRQQALPLIPQFSQLKTGD